MSLQIWLPFNGSLVNQGVYNSTITSTSPQYSTSGKIGKALSLASNGNYTVKTTYTQSNNEMSICFWVNPNNPGIWSDIFSFGGNNRMEVSSDDKKSYTWYVDSGKQGLISSGTYLFGLNLSTWSHVVIAIDTSSVYFYVNGVLTKTVGRLSTTLANIFAENAFFYVGARVGNSSCYAGLINDFRVYDECLSPKQVKEISKGLVCHYALDNNGYGMANLLGNTNTNRSDRFGYSEQTGGSTASVEWDGGTPCTKITRNSTAHSGWAYMWHNNLYTSDLKVSTTYTVSFDCIASGSGTIGLSGFMNGNATNQLSASTQTIQGSFNSTSWSHMVFRTTTKSSFADLTVSGQVVYMSCSYMNNVNVWIKVKNFKVEEGALDTPWCPHISDASYAIFNINGNKEIDISGYGNHGNKEGIITPVSDSPRYSVAYNYTAGAGVFGHPAIVLSQYTISFWGKHVATGKMLFGSNVSSSSLNATWYWYGDNSFKYPSGEFYYEHNAGSADSMLNKWVHFVAIYDGSNVKVYRNAIYEGSKAATGTMTLDYVSVGVGYHTASYWENGFVSDFRLYATALSADDIKELYQVSASIDNKGNILGYDFQE